MVFSQLPGTLFLLFVVASFTSIPSPVLSKSVLDQGTDPAAISCYKNNGQTPMVGDTPHPFDCNTIVTCVTAAGGGVTYIYKPCQTGHDGTPLFYDFRHCMCLEREFARCYDFESEDDQEHRFDCADEL